VGEVEIETAAARETPYVGCGTQQDCTGPTYSVGAIKKEGSGANSEEALPEGPTSRRLTLLQARKESGRFSSRSRIF
jgi:hypothetical protein